MSSKHFVEHDTIVQDALQAQTFLNPALALDYENKALLNTSHDGDQKVTLISGGGAGHEPSFAAYVGEGFLSAAVSGFIFASPSTQQVLNTIHQTGGKAGTILVIMNYTGDVLNFMLAAEQARLAGHNTEVIVVGDDVSVGRKKGGRVGRRGLAGTVLVLKALGALAQSRGSLDEIFKTGEDIAKNLVTVGVALDHVHVPGRQVTESTLSGNQLELGMGIHNEPGCKVLEPKPEIKDLVKQIFDQLLDQSDSDRAFVNFSDAEHVVLLVNNLGGVSQLEFGAVIKVVYEEAVSRNLKLNRIYAGTFMTSLDGKGFSITLLKTSDRIIKLLDDPATAAGWSGFSLPLQNLKEERKTTFVASKVAASRTKSSLILDLSQFKSALISAANSVIKAEPQITEYDTIVGDGDCGTTIARFANGVLRDINTNKFDDDAVAAIEQLAAIVQETMDGTSGALYAIFFNAFASALQVEATKTSQATPVSASIWAAAAVIALKTLQKATPALVGDRTLMDALVPLIDALAEGSSLGDAVSKAEAGKESTKGMRPAFGRAVYVQEAGWDKVPDPGAESIVALMKGLLR